MVPKQNKINKVFIFYKKNKNSVKYKLSNNNKYYYYNLKI